MKSVRVSINDSAVEEGLYMGCNRAGWYEVAVSRKKRFVDAVGWRVFSFPRYEVNNGVVYVSHARSRRYLTREEQALVERSVLEEVVLGASGEQLGLFE